MVLELISDAITATSLDRLLAICNLWIVEEVKLVDTDNKSKLVVQFENATALDIFEREHILYMNESEEQGALTASQSTESFRRH